MTSEDGHGHMLPVVGSFPAAGVGGMLLIFEERLEADRGHGHLYRPQLLPKQPTLSLTSAADFFLNICILLK